MVGLALDPDTGVAGSSASDAGAPASTGTDWYYCVDPPGYFPYVATCNRPWVVVAPFSVGGSSAPVQ